MREALRLQPTAPMRSAKSLEPTTLGGGKYNIAPDDILVVNDLYMHRDHAVWGEDVCPPVLVLKFNPDLFLG